MAPFVFSSGVSTSFDGQQLNRFPKSDLERQYFDINGFFLVIRQALNLDKMGLQRLIVYVLDF